MRDLETTEAALRIAETGQLTLATLHTSSAVHAVGRVIDLFPAHQQAQVRTQLSLVLEGVVCQSLVPAADGSGRVCAVEVLVVTPAIRNLIREDKAHLIYAAMQAGRKQRGMQTMTQALADLHRRRRITLEQALDHRREPRGAGSPDCPWTGRSGVDGAGRTESDEGHVRVHRTHAPGQADQREASRIVGRGMPSPCSGASRFW